MAKCPECEKVDLKPGEKLCPYCRSESTRRKVKTVEVAGTMTAALGAIAAVAWKILKGRKG